MQKEITTPKKEKEKEKNKIQKKFDIKIRLEDNPYELAMKIISNNNLGFNHFEKIVESIKACQKKMKKN